MRTAFQLMGLGGDGDAVEPVSEEQIERVVERKVAAMDASSGPSEPVESVQDALLSEFQEQAVTRTMQKVNSLSDRQRKLLRYLEGRGTTISSKKAWVQNALGWESTNSDVLEDIREMEDVGLVRKNKDGSDAPNIDGMLETEPHQMFA